MLSEKEAYLSSVKKRLLQYEKAGVKLYLDGNPSDTDHIMRNVLRRMLLIWQTILQMKQEKLRKSDMI